MTESPCKNCRNKDKPKFWGNGQGCAKRCEKIKAVQKVTDLKVNTFDGEHVIYAPGVRGGAYV